jgi:hypothetical protein
LNHEDTKGTKKNERVLLKITIDSTPHPDPLPQGARETIFYTLLPLSLGFWFDGYIGGFPYEGLSGDG